MADHPNVDLLRKGYDAFAKGDMDTLRELFAEGIVWHVPGNNMLSGDYQGRDAVFGFFGKLLQESGGSFRQEVHDVLANDTHGVVLVDAHAERGGKTLDTHAVHVMHVDDGQVTEFWNLVEDTTKADDFWS
jgi:ketosteroid isomerase-like protein